MPRAAGISPGGPGDRFWRPEQNLESFAGVAGRSEIEFSLTTPPPGRSEGPGPLRRKQKRVLFSAVTRTLQSLPYMDNKSSGKTRNLSSHDRDQPCDVLGGRRKKWPNFCPVNTFHIFKGFSAKSALRATRNRHHRFHSKRGSVPFLAVHATIQRPAWACSG